MTSRIVVIQHNYMYQHDGSFQMTLVASTYGNRGTKPWLLLTSSVEDLKSISTALWEAMDFGGKILENITPGYRDFWDYGRICTLFGALLSGGLAINLSACYQCHQTARVSFVLRQHHSGFDVQNTKSLSKPHFSSGLLFYLRTITELGKHWLEIAIDSSFEGHMTP